MGAIIVQNLSMTPSMHSGMNKLYRQIVSLFCILTICFYFSCFVVTLVACFVMVRDYLYILLTVNTAEFYMLILDVCVKMQLLKTFCANCIFKMATALNLRDTELSQGLVSNIIVIPYNKSVT